MNVGVELPGMVDNVSDSTPQLERSRRSAVGGFLLTGLVAAGVLALDQATKAWVTQNMVSHESRELIEGVLRLRYTENTGAAFGLFQGWTGALSIVAVAIIGVIVLSASKMGSGSRALLLALGLVLGGALGNLVDRLRLGYVVDFIEMSAARLDIGGTTYTFPVFNVADSSITVGVILIMATLIFAPHDAQPVPASATEPQPPLPVRRKPSPSSTED
jgi:signal peptidase II